MRSTGSYGLQQALTPDAAGVVKQALALAKRRGHAQVTPLHVASTMLSAPSGLLRAACLQSHSHPLQCKALELCFNVALNRLPASSSSPMSTLSHHSHYPSISNALVAAFKRAQAHQRRGVAENQPQPLLAAKVELDQLIISILDDPSVSRVMREAGFSSTQVKTNVEKTVSNSSEFSSPPKESTQISSQIVVKPTSSEPSKNDDVSIIVENLLKRKRKNLVIVGESISTVETTVKQVTDRVDKGNVPEELRDVKFVSIPPWYSFCNFQRDLVEKKMGELSCLVRSLMRKGVVLYLGDLNWVSEYRVDRDQHERSYYCSVEHMIMELGRLAYEIGDDDQNGRFWLMGIATIQTYMRCRTGKHSLETVWGLHPVTVPSNTLGLTLVSQSDEYNIEARNGRKEYGSVDLCTDCSSKFEAEARDMKNSSACHSNEPTLSKLPPWMIKDRGSYNNNDQKCESQSMKELSEKWNSYCRSGHQQLTLSSASPSSSSSSCFSFDRQNPNYPHQTCFPQLEPVLGDPKLVFSSNPGPDPNSPSSSDVVMDMRYVQKYKEFNAQNLNTLCDALEKKVPWQREIIPEIAGTVLQCRSRMLRRKEKSNVTDQVKEETWLLFLGVDAQAKETISRELAKVVFGSYSNFSSIGSNSFISSEKWDLLDDHRKKRVREEESSSSYAERFAQAVSENPHRVFFLQDFEEADYCSQMAIKEAIDRGRISRGNGIEEVGFCDAIVVLSCERFGSGPGSGACSPSSKQKMDIGEEERSPNCMSLDLNISFDDDDGVVNRSIDETGIFERVDRSVVFKLHEM